MASGWDCPRCGLVLAPHVNEHRCDPPAAGVTVAPCAPAGPGGTSVSAAPEITYHVGGGSSGSGGTVTSISGGTLTSQELAGHVQGAMLRQQHAGRGPGFRSRGIA